ncbi:hypothetical protein K0504_12315 [Neiella marina]|uniref:Integrase catalytic domain-containing protein n=1 Tax=Neiella holothuriorum TaxID=2870530 RepID=A0ABS7EHK7_9GAMM|nr:hypothetical protein [Neiella holothuriorum]MBW8191821.1 hypothetical protein [Neiella holothuriorum]
MNFRVGICLYNEQKGIDWRVCHVCPRLNVAAIADMGAALTNNNCKKPTVYTFKKLRKLIAQKSLESGFYELPLGMRVSPEMLIEQNREKWLEKRSRRFELIEPLTAEHVIRKYLYGDGIGSEIAELIDSGTECRTPGAFYNALNRYITFGMNVLALTPFNLKNTGSNFKYVDINGKPIKRGRGGHDNAQSRSKTRGITEQDKKDIKSIIKQLKKGEKKKFSVSRAWRVYQKQFCRTELLRKYPSSGKELPYYIKKREQDRISEQQFRYHLKKLLGPEAKKILIHGATVYEKDHADRQGHSHDGVLGATDRYETDATVLDIYVRYPYTRSERLTMGRPVLYLVVDVYSTAIAGFYIGFSGPNWQGMANAYVNACMDKVQFAASYGITIKPDDWPIHHVPKNVLTDNGAEHKDALVNSALLEQIGIQGFSFAAAYRGDMKGVVEGTFAIVNNERIQYLAGSIFKEQDRTDQHPSNNATYSYDDLVRKLITIIIEYNNSANRLSKQNINMMRDDVEATPQGIFNYSLKEEMNGGHGTAPEEEATIRWAFIPEETATVRADCVYFKGLKYHSPEFKCRGLYAKAKAKRFKIPVKRTLNCVNTIWHRTEEGQYIKLALKNTNNESPYLNQCWAAVLHRLEQNKDIAKDLKENELDAMNYSDELISDTVEGIKQVLEQSSPNTNQSMQTGVKERQDEYKQFQAAMDARNLAAAVGSNSSEPDTPAPQIHHDINDDDDDIYG